MEDTNATPRLINGGLHVDTRGTVGFVNEFDVKEADRFYWIRAHQPNTPRGWVGHRREQKWFTVLQGAVLIAVVRPDRWESPSRDLPVERFVLSAAKPQVLHVPPGYVTGSVDLARDSILAIFSTGKPSEAKSDDFRFPTEQWKLTENHA